MFWNALNPRTKIHLVKQKGRAFNIAIIAVYAPPAQSTEEDAHKVYSLLDSAKAQYKPQKITIMGDLNTRVGKRIR